MRVWDFFTGRRTWPGITDGEQRYTALDEEDDAHTPPSKSPRQTPVWPPSQIILTLILCLGSFLVGLTLGKRHDSDQTISLLLQSQTNTTLLPDTLKPPGTIVRRFDFHKIYSSPPSNESNAAWAEVAPRPGQGFMRSHSHLSNISEFSVFHQLHCIDTLRHGYYAALRLAEDEDSSTERMSTKRKAKAAAMKEKNHHHVTHCFDFLRQCVQCSADTNLEPVDWTKGGVTGWGFERVCRDFASVKKHAEEWRVPGIE